MIIYIPLIGYFKFGYHKTCKAIGPECIRISVKDTGGRVADVFTSSGAGITLSSDDRLAVPDGGNTLMLLGSALSVLGFGVFRKSRKA